MSVESVVDSEQDIGPLRTELDVNQLNEYLSPKPNGASPSDTTLASSIHTWKHLPIKAPLTNVHQFKFGQSNPTFLLTDSSNNKFVLRKKPTSNAKLISKTAHAIEREFFMLDSISNINQSRTVKVPVVQVYLLCEDESQIGSVFYIMEFVKGRIFHDASLSNVKSSSERQKIWKSVVETAHAIHTIPSKKLFDQLPSRFFKKPDTKHQKSNFFKRQVRSLSKIHQLQSKEVPEIPHFHSISNWLSENSPDDVNPQNPTLIHGDFKMDNFIFDSSEPKIIAVLDWELCTNGHPLFDLANVLQPFSMPLKLNKFFSKFDIEPDDDLINKVLALYIKEYSFDQENLDWDPVGLWKVGVVFGLYRVGVICQGIAQRVVKGVASSAKAKETGQMFPFVGEYAFKVISGSSKSQTKL